MPTGDKAIMVYLIIEAVIFLIPLITLFIKVGRYTQRIDELEKKVDRLDGIDSKLATIDAKVDLLIQGKIKNDAEK